MMAQGLTRAARTAEREIHRAQLLPSPARGEGIGTGMKAEGLTRAARTAEMETRRAQLLPSPPAGEGGPQGRMSGRFGVGRQGR